MLDSNYQQVYTSINRYEGMQAMIELKRNGSQWQVVRDGQIVLEGTMHEARAEYSRLMAAALEGRTRKRKVFR